MDHFPFGETSVKNFSKRLEEGISKNFPEVKADGHPSYLEWKARNS